MKKALAAIAMFCGCMHVQAQEDVIPRDIIEQRIEAASDQLGDDSSVDLTALVDQLTDRLKNPIDLNHTCLLYTSDAADERSSVDLGGRRIIKKKKNQYCLLYKTDATMQNRCLSLISVAAGCSYKQHICDHMWCE